MPRSCALWISWHLYFLGLSSSSLSYSQASSISWRGRFSEQKQTIIPRNLQYSSCYFQFQSMSQRSLPWCSHCFHICCSFHKNKPEVLLLECPTLLSFFFWRKIQSKSYRAKRRKRCPLVVLERSSNPHL